MAVHHIGRFLCCNTSREETFASYNADIEAVFGGAKYGSNVAKLCLRFLTNMRMF